MASTYLNKAGATATDRRIFTISMWVKKTKVGNDEHLYETYNTGNAVNDRFTIQFSSSDALQVINKNSGNTDCNKTTNRLFRDVNGWYHIVVAINTKLATASERVRIYVNGIEETSFSTNSPFPQNEYPQSQSSSYPTQIGRYNQGSNYFDGYMSHIHFIDGTQYSASDFGETDSTTGEWKIKTSPSVTYGNNGFFILKDGNSVTDQSGNSNNFTVAGGTLTNTEDSPSNVFCIMNAISRGSISTSNGSTTISGGAGDNSIVGTIACGSGKYYWEAKCTNASTYANIGVTLSSAYGGTHSEVDAGRVAYQNNGAIYREGLSGQGHSSNLATFTTNDIIGVAFDTENGTLSFYKNGTLVNTTTDNDLLFSNNEYIPCNGMNNGGWSYNFGNGYFGTTAVSSAGTNASGNGIFEYDVPTGYTALSTKGLNL
jgi:hypothetical protein